MLDVAASLPLECGALGCAVFTLAMMHQNLYAAIIQIETSLLLTWDWAQFLKLEM